MKSVLKIIGSSFAHVYMNPYTAKSGEKGAYRLSFILGETSSVRYQWVQFYSAMYISFCALDLHNTRRYIHPYNVPNPEF